MFSKYTRGRELYWSTSPDGQQWSEDQKLAGILGHYQVSSQHGKKIGTFFNRHPEGSVDRRTDLYYAQTTDMGQTWTTVDGQILDLPLEEEENPARVIEYSARERLIYTVDLNWDADGNPVLLYVTSGGFAPGPENEPRFWEIARWNGSEWETSAARITITISGVCTFSATAGRSSVPPRSDRRRGKPGAKSKFGKAGIPAKPGPKPAKSPSTANAITRSSAVR